MKIKLVIISATIFFGHAAFTMTSVDVDVFGDASSQSDDTVVEYSRTYRCPKNHKTKLFFAKSQKNQTEEQIAAKAAIGYEKFLKKKSANGLKLMKHIFCFSKKYHDVLTVDQRNSLATRHNSIHQFLTIKANMVGNNMRKTRGL